MASRKQRDSWLRSRFGIHLRDYEVLLEAQDGKCAICLHVPKKGHRPLAVDHCHKTGKIRGLLCGRCNQLLGNMGDNLEGVMRYVRYLKMPPVCSVVAGNGKQRVAKRIPKLCRRKDGRAYVTDNLTGRTIYFGAWGEQADIAYQEWLGRHMKKIEVANRSKRRKDRIRAARGSRVVNVNKEDRYEQTSASSHSFALQTKGRPLFRDRSPHAQASLF